MPWSEAWPYPARRDRSSYDLGAALVFNGSDVAAHCLAGGQHQEFLRSGSTHVMSMPYVLVEGERATALGYSHVFQNMHDGSFKVVRGSIHFWAHATPREFASQHARPNSRMRVRAPSRLTRSFATAIVDKESR